MSLLEQRIARLQEQGVILVDPRQIYVDEEVDLDRIAPGCVLHPGTRLHGARTYLAPGAEVGREGPATLVDSVFAEGARIDSGYAHGAVLLRDAHVGAAAHLRSGTVLEEEASTAHCVGLKQTVLLSFVSLGSLINFCDGLIAGGTSKRDHSEVGSGYIHFNFTPWGKAGDKATPSLVGDVVSGVFLRERRTFLGGAGGMVGPRQVGFGAIVGAGQVLRRDIEADRLVLDVPRSVDRPLWPGITDRLQPRARKNLEFIAQLMALLCWYRAVRLPRAEQAGPHMRPVLQAAAANLVAGVEERRRRLQAFLSERGATMPELAIPEPEPCPLPLSEGPAGHVAWVQGLTDADRARGGQWLQKVVQQVLDAAATGPR